jgi:uncharacterized membrane protein YfcA
MIALKLPDHILKKIFGILLIFIALRLIFAKQAGVAE